MAEHLIALGKRKKQFYFLGFIGGILQGFSEDFNAEQVLPLAGKTGAEFGSKGNRLFQVAGPLIAPIADQTIKPFFNIVFDTTGRPMVHLLCNPGIAFPVRMPIFDLSQHFPSAEEVADLVLMEGYF